VRKLWKPIDRPYGPPAGSGRRRSRWMCGRRVAFRTHHFELENPSRARTLATSRAPMRDKEAAEGNRLAPPTAWREWEAQFAMDVPSWTCVRGRVSGRISFELKELRGVPQSEKTGHFRGSYEVFRSCGRQ
jgi:hypothetical protein